MKKVFLYLFLCFLLISCTENNTPNIINIEIVNQPEKVTYYIDEDICFDGLIVQLNFDDGTSNIINDYEIIF